ncbi:AfsR/SARP family transcriptional regulator [Paractinoplanes maris]|uniref:AfsR/SARP family transcriptional regulator n=1 Tax=Paractinoplanes maris TaxID=1734446 RepID=UPI002020A9AC|nr:BTAD domain-containing putative transcriptional regulator [Actinoplanes maris]
MTTGEGDDVRLGLLGPVRLWRRGREIPAGPRHQRLILALLLARTGQLVETQEFARLLWDGDPPPTAKNMIQRYVGGLRRLLEPDLAPRTPSRLLLSDAGGYRLVLPERASDLLEFRLVHDAARRAAASGDATRALRHFLAGLRLWRGRVAAGLGSAVEVCPDLMAIEREYVDAVRGAADAALCCGGESQILPLLREAVSRTPLDEALQARLLRVLAGDSKQAEAVVRYDELRRALADELGVSPGPELQAAFQSVLRSGDAGTHGSPTAHRPAQLPSDLRMFVGRSRELREASTVLTAGGRAMAIVAFDGMAGVGKSTLAVHLGHQLTTRFPDGQLYADLHGFGADRPVDPSDVLHQFLLALGIDPQHIPAGLESRAALYRSVTAGRRLLVVLDGAGTTEQIRPLLPGASGNAVVVTGRQRFTGLSTGHGATLLSLDVFSAQEARLCLERRLGTARVDAESAAAQEIAERCGHLPLALALVAARAALEDDRPLRSFAGVLSHRRGTLEAFTDETMDVDIRRVFGQSQRLLSAGAVRMLRALALHGDRIVTTDTAAAVAGVAPAQARASLTELVRHRLLNRRGASQFALHELVRAYAAEDHSEAPLSGGDRRSNLRIAS